MTGSYEALIVSRDGVAVSDGDEGVADGGAVGYY